MTSREIIIKLIDGNLISGEEAVQLLNDIIVSEIYQAEQLVKDKPKDGGYHLWPADLGVATTTTGITWTGGPDTTGTYSSCSSK